MFLEDGELFLHLLYLGEVYDKIVMQKMGIIN